MINVSKLKSGDIIKAKACISKRGEHWSPYGYMDYLLNGVHSLKYRSGQSLYTLDNLGKIKWIVRHTEFSLVKQYNIGIFKIL